MSEEGLKRVSISEAQARNMMEKQHQQQEQQDAQNEQKEAMLRAFVSDEGRARLKRIEQVKPERAHAVEVHIINACRGGKLVPPVSDDIVRELLVSAAGGAEGATANKITVVRKKMGEDDW